MAELAPGSLTDVLGLRVGHASDLQALTGCSVVLCGEGVRASCVVRGLAPGTRETDLLRAGTLVDSVHAILLTGGSAFGLAAADGVMRYLEQQGVGYDVGGVRVPIVPGAVLFDLGIGNPGVRPDAAMGYSACQAATDAAGSQGNTGAGTGATVGKVLGVEFATKGGLGTVSLRAGDLIVAAMVAVNAVGDVIDPSSGRIVAGARRADGRGYADISRLLRIQSGQPPTPLGNTVIGVVATNARLDVAQLRDLASAGHDGLARAIRPAHTLYDGDTIFSLATGVVEANPLLLGDLAAEAVSLAILNGVLAAQAAGGLPAAQTCFS